MSDVRALDAASPTARFRVHAAGPLVTFQDSGRPGHMRFGVARSGPMDEVAHAAANLALGNDVGATAIEVSRVGCALDLVAGTATIATTGGGATVVVDGRPVDHWCATPVVAGQRIEIRQGSAGSWTYLAVAGDMVVPRWLGRSATHSTSGLGGGALVVGDEFDVATARVAESRLGGIPVFESEPAHGAIRVVLGPQHRHFRPSVLQRLTASTYRLTDAYDRMGVRLDGPPLTPEQALSIPSEPIVRGSVQVSGDGTPTVLLADHQTTGGYPKIATVVSCDLDRLVQLRSGDEVRFTAVEPMEAVRLARDHRARVDAHLDRVAGEGRTLDHRLRRSSLVSGVVEATLHPDH